MLTERIPSDIVGTGVVLRGCIELKRSGGFLERPLTPNTSGLTGSHLLEQMEIFIDIDKELT